MKIELELKFLLHRKLLLWRFGDISKVIFGFIGFFIVKRLKNICDFKYSTPTKVK